MTTSAAERLETGLKSKLMWARNGPFKIVKTLPTTVPIDEDVISSTVLIERITLAPALTAAQDVMDDANHGNKDGLPTDTMQKIVHTKHAMRQNLILDESDQDVIRQNLHSKLASWQNEILDNMQETEEVATPRNGSRKHATPNRRKTTQCRIEEASTASDRTPCERRDGDNMQRKRNHTYSTPSNRAHKKECNVRRSKHKELVWPWTGERKSERWISGRSRRTRRTPQEHAIDCKVCHIVKGPEVNYVKRWYGNNSAEDTVEPPKNFCQHFLHTIGAGYVNTTRD